jgi:hypothetical protein
MAQNIFNADDYAAIIKRIEALTPNAQRKWGTMTLPQMLEHCILQLKLALGIITNNEKKTSFLNTAFGRWMALYIAPWPKGGATPQAMNVTLNMTAIDEVTVEKERLLQLLQTVQQHNHFQPHPFFGAVNKKDWGRLIWKHLNHHLKQFGV